MVQFKTEPDGTKIAFISEQHFTNIPSIYVMNADGSNQFNITNNPERNDSVPVWSPDGEKIAFMNYHGMGDDIYVMNTDGSSQFKLAEGEYPAWSPDSTKLIFSNYQSYDHFESSYDIYVINANGTGLTNLTNDPETNYSIPEWSPDDTKIAFVIYRNGPNELYVMNADGSNQTMLTDTQIAPTSPIWSPDGTKIAYTSVSDGIWNVFVMDADGKNQTNITNNALDGDADYFRSWSSNGSKIIYSSSNGPKNHAIWIMNVDGTEKTKLADYSVRIVAERTIFS